MIHLDLRSREPIYEQIAAGFRRLALAGVLEPGSQLPSVRQLSAELGVNPNTVHRAYTLLEERGVTYSQPGRGSYISPDMAQKADAAREMALEGLTRQLIKAREAGVSRQEAAERLEEVYHV
ncbi:MAG: GntR family transcriptional regulator [Christensenellales bacterium]|jgi:GntR family transcriptional regulator